MSLDPVVDVVALLQALIRIPSPNPPGDTCEIAAFVAAFLQQHGCDDVQQHAPPAKPQAVSVIGTLRGAHAGPTIMLHAHIDTVPIAADEAARWSVDPYGGVIRDGRIYGKGSVDDKAPLAAMLTALATCAAQRDRLRGTLVLVAAAEEETGGVLGTKWLAESGLLPSCDFIIVGEQTENRVANAHKGVLRATVRAYGRSVHATDPDRGVNAIAVLARAVLALERYHQALANRVHPTVGVPTCNVGVIEGGSTANAVPDSAAAYLDRRMIPHEDPETVKRELEAVVAAVDLRDYGPEARLTVGDYQVSNWFASSVESALGRAFMASVRCGLNADPGPIGYLPGSDAKHLVGCAQAGEMVIFGPGSYKVAHAFDEYTAVDELQTTTSILIHFVETSLLNGAEQ
jgi:acetylornithine deacetylase/succinyl-diaminopimelate desuccinylase family protein